MDVAHQAPPSMGFSRREYWSGVPFPSPREARPDSGIKPGSPALQADSLPFEPSPDGYLLKPVWLKDICCVLPEKAGRMGRRWEAGSGTLGTQVLM